MASCPHCLHLQPANQNSKLYKDECVMCFDDVCDKGGLDVCLNTFKAFCVGALNHSYQHRQRTGYCVFLNIKRLYKPRQKEKEITSVEIGGEGGARLDEMKGSYEHRYTLHCYSCNVDLDYKADPHLNSLVDAVINLDSEANKSDVQAWKQEILPCEHTLTLQQVPNAPKLGSKNMSHCGMCDLDKNLWLCLTCGHLGCGRQLMEIGTNINLGGNGHALDHHNKTGHPFCVKIGTITPQGEADLYCYACDNDVKDLELAAHLAYFGINISSQTKTEKTIAEMTLEQNLRAGLFSSKENGKIMKSVFGPGMTGINNVGNSCYMASVLQCVAAIPAFRERYSPDHQHSATCDKHPAECYHCQMEKLFDGLQSGRYSCIREYQRLPAPEKKDEMEVEKEEKEKEPEEKQVEEEQRGISPKMFKKLVCKDHIDFGGMQQQDAYEFFQFLIKAVQRYERAVKGGKQDPSKVFNLQLEQRNECNVCHHARYSTVDQTELKFGMPLEHADPPLAPKDGETKEQVEERESISTIPFSKCLQCFREPETVRGFHCSICKTTTTLSQTTLVSKFPKILMANVSRFTYDGWVNEARKLFVNIGFDDVVDLATIAAPPHPEGEKLFPEDQQGGGPVINQEWVANLSAMGFESDVCAYAIEETGSAGMEQALNWLFEHGSSPETMAAIAERKNKGKKKASGPPVNEFAVEMICSMGFSNAQAIHALGETGGDAERAADWLFNHPDFIPPEAGPVEEEEEEEEEKEEGTGNSQYELFGVVQHRGTSIGSGHYVAYLRTDVGWVQFNDSKVTESLTPPIGQGYIYFFKQK
mmetsp:Transcript_31668/g.49510  ORF Transcript_31668/g.49510 Transcript_31668/m.49510 type:complete len:815 (-) Transcript_31668:65-2509(-)